MEITQVDMLTGLTNEVVLVLFVIGMLFVMLSTVIDIVILVLLLSKGKGRS